MRRVRRASLVLAGALLAQGCDWSAPLAWLRIRSIREVSAHTALDWLREGRGLVVQLRDPEEHLPILPGAEPLGRDAPIPASLAETRQWILVVASRPAEAMRLAARVSRSGHSRVAVVTGDLTALRERRTAAREGAEAAQPSATGRHRSN